MRPFAFLAGLLDTGVSAEAIRSEIFFLGSRHRGEALDGARQELAAADLDPGRSRLLRAVVDHLTHPQSSGRTPAAHTPSA
jgi:hypothetical protein